MENWLNERVSIPVLHWVVQLTKTKVGWGVLLLEMHYILVTLNLKGQPNPTSCIEKLLFVPVEFAIGLYQCFSTLAVYYNHLEN